MTAHGQQPSCGLCSAEISEYWKYTHGSYRVCVRCGLVQLLPEQRVHEGAERARYLEHHNSFDNPQYRAYLMDFASRNLLPFLRSGGAVLDFGCGQSTTLARLLSQEGYKAAAYDKLFFPDPEPLQGASRYDAVAVVEVLEHLATPRKELHTLSRLLRPGGFLAARTELRPESREAFGDWWYRRDPTHITFYNRRTLDVICELFGFEPVRCARGREIVLRRGT